MVLDFKKAFDKVPHVLLMQKLKQVPDMHLQLVDWVQDFLTNRRQRVVITGESSSEVPQGSVLGPTLFIIYINDLPLRVDCNVSLYADDTLLYQPVDTIDDAVQFQNNIDAVQKWSVDWKMPFNDKKFKVIAFGSQNYRPTNKLGETVIDWADKTTYLGVVMQSNLKFDQHIALKKDKASKTLEAIKHILNQAPQEGRLLAYTSLCPMLGVGSNISQRN